MGEIRTVSICSHVGGEFGVCRSRSPCVNISRTNEDLFYQWTAWFRDIPHVLKSDPGGFGVDASSGNDAFKPLL